MTRSRSSSSRLRRGAVAASLLALAAGAAQGASLARPGVPAIVAARAAKTPAAHPRVVLVVRAFTPPPGGGTVEIVVKASRRGGAEKEIGRVGIFPHAAFSADGPGEMRRFGFDPPPGTGKLTLRVFLEPVQGSAEGARLDVEGAELR